MAATTTEPGIGTAAEIPLGEGASLLALSQRAPVLLVFLRHLGCIFCREAVSELLARRAEIEAVGAEVVLVHHSTAEQEAAFLAEFPGARAFHWVRDPERRHYQAYGVGRAGVAQLLSPVMWLRGLQATLRGFKQAGVQGDPKQMPGAFVICGGEIVAKHQYSTLGDRPDYIALLQ